MTKRTDNIIIIGAIIFLIGFIMIVHVPFIQDGDNVISIRDMIAEMMEEEPIACIQVFDPVCTIRGTFSNQCEADVAGATTLYKGQCP